MKSLILMRHGKSSWEYSGASDSDRPLLERGINDAYLVASKFSQEKIKIDAAYSSPANRALHTSMIFMKTLNISLSKFQVTNELYDFSGESVFQFVKKMSNEMDVVLIFGHNNAFTHIANTLGNEYIENVSTAGLVHIEFLCTTWKEISQGTTKQILFPKQLR